MSFFGIRFGGHGEASNPIAEACTTSQTQSDSDVRASYRICSENDGEREMTQEEVNQLVHDALRRARRATSNTQKSAAADVSSPLSDASTPSSSGRRGITTSPPAEDSMLQTLLTVDSDPSQSHMDELLSPTMDSLIGSIGNSHSMMSTNSGESILRKVEEEIQAARLAALQTTKRLRVMSQSSSFDQPHEIVLSPTAELMEILDDHLADDEDLRETLNVDDDQQEEPIEVILDDELFELAQEEVDAEFANSPTQPSKSASFDLSPTSENRRLHLEYIPEPEPDAVSILVNKNDTPNLIMEPVVSENEVSNPNHYDSQPERGIPDDILADDVKDKSVLNNQVDLSCESMNFVSEEQYSPQSQGVHPHGLENEMKCEESDDQINDEVLAKGDDTMSKPELEKSRQVKVDTAGELMVHESEMVPVSPPLVVDKYHDYETTSEPERLKNETSNESVEPESYTCEPIQLKNSEILPIEMVSGETLLHQKASDFEEKKDENDCPESNMPLIDQQSSILPCEPGIEVDVESMTQSKNLDYPEEEGFEAHDVLIKWDSGDKSNSDYESDAVVDSSSGIQSPKTLQIDEEINDSHDPGSLESVPEVGVTAPPRNSVVRLGELLSVEHNIGTSPLDECQSLKHSESEYTEVTVSDIPRIGRDVVVSADNIPEDDDVSAEINASIGSDYTEETVSDQEECQAGRVESSLLIESALNLVASVQDSVNGSNLTLESKPIDSHPTGDDPNAACSMEVLRSSTREGSLENDTVTEREGLFSESCPVVQSMAQPADNAETPKSKSTSQEDELTEQGEPSSTAEPEVYTSESRIATEVSEKVTIFEEKMDQDETHKSAVRSPVKLMIETGTSRSSIPSKEVSFALQQVTRPQMPNQISPSSVMSERSSVSLAPTPDKIYFRYPYPFPPPLPKPRPPSMIIQAHSLGVPEAFTKWSRTSSELEKLLLAVYDESLHRRSNACGALKVLSQQKKNQLALVRSEGFLDALVFAINSQIPANIEADMAVDARGRAVATLLNVSEPKANRQLVCVHSGVVECLLKVVADDVGESRVQACAAIGTLAKTPANREFLATVPGLLDSLAIALLGSLDDSTHDDETDQKDSVEESFESESLHEGETNSAQLSSSTYEDDGTQDGTAQFDDNTQSDDNSFNHDDEHTSLEVSSSVSSGLPPSRNASKEKSIRDHKHSLHDQFYMQARVNACASLMHLSKHCAVSNCLGLNSLLVQSLVEVSIEFDNPIHTRCLEMICNLTRFPANCARLSRDSALINTLMLAGKSKNPEDRKWAMRSFQNLASDSSSKALLANSQILTLLSISSMRNEYDEQLAAVATIYNLSTEPGAVVPLTNTRNVVATLVHLAHNAVDTPVVRSMACDTLATIGLWLQTLAGSGSVPEGVTNILLPTHLSSGWEKWE